MPELIVKVGSVVVLLGGLIFVHELGHFLVAKLLGVKVIRFSIGFGPRLFGFQRGETEYRLAVLPLGGYVKMAGDDPSEQPAPEDRGRGFLEQSPWRRLLIASAGPAMNLLLPGALFTGILLAMNGEPTPGPTVGTVAAGSPAERAGLEPGDRIVSVASPGAPAQPVGKFFDLVERVSPHPGEPLTFQVQRGDRLLALTITPDADEDASNPVERTTRGVIGVAASYLPAAVAPARRGAAGPLEPFDLVVGAGGAPVRNGLDLTRAVAAAACAPLDLDVLRERPRALPGAVLGDFEPVHLSAVPTCAGGEPAFRLSDPFVSTFVAAVEPGGPADRAGLRRGDAIAAVDGAPVKSFKDLEAVIGRALSPGKPAQLALADGRTLTLVPGTQGYVDELTRHAHQRPTVGFASARRPLVDPRALDTPTVPLQRGVGEVLSLAWAELVRELRTTVLGLAKIVTREISAENLGGPIQIMKITQEAAEQGWSVFLSTMALISVNLGLMNLLPIPVLDGGHIAQAVLETVTRRPLSLRAREIANMVGLILLVGLMLFAFKNDIVRQIQGR